MKHVSNKTHVNFNKVQSLIPLYFPWCNCVLILSWWQKRTRVRRVCRIIDIIHQTFLFSFSLFICGSWHSWCEKEEQVTLRRSGFDVRFEIRVLCFLLKSYFQPSFQGLLWLFQPGTRSASRSALSPKQWHSLNVSVLQREILPLLDR